MKHSRLSPHFLCTVWQQNAGEEPGNEGIPCTYWLLLIDPVQDLVWPSVWSARTMPTSERTSLPPTPSWRTLSTTITPHRTPPPWWPSSSSTPPKQSRNCCSGSRGSAYCPELCCPSTLSEYRYHNVITLLVILLHYVCGSAECCLISIMCLECYGNESSAGRILSLVR